MKPKVKNSYFILLLLFIGQQVYAQQCAQFTPVSIGNDTTLCTGQSLSLSVSASQSYDHILWDDNSTSPARTVTTSGIYWVRVTSVGNNLIQNGDFEQGNTLFSTEYVVGTGGSWGQLSLPGTYAITTSPSYVHNNFLYCTDHTPGAGQKEMVVNGAGNPGKKVWCETVSVNQNTEYEFSTWVTNVTNNPVVAQLQFTINGNTIGSIFSPSPYSCDWSQFYQEWNAGITTSAEVCITNMNLVDAGNDFAIDDIYFAPVCTSSDTIHTNYLNYPTFTLPTDYNACEGDTVSLDAENSGFNYQWNTAATTKNIKVDTSGIYKVKVSNVGGLCADSTTFNIAFHTPPNAGSDSTLAFCNTDQQVDLFSLLNSATLSSGNWIDTTANPVVNGNVSITNKEGLIPYYYLLAEPYCPTDTSVITLNIKKYKSAGTDFSTQLCNAGILDLNTHISAATGGIWNSLDGLSPQNFNPSTGIVNLNGLVKNDYQFNYSIPNVLPCPADTAYFTISVSEYPLVHFTADTTEGCSPLAIHFSDLSEGNGGKSYQWSIEGEDVGVDDSTFDYTFVDHHKYDIGLEVTMDGLCTKDTTYSNYIVVDPNPVADFKFSPDPVFSNNPEVEFKNQSELNATNSWDFAGLDSSTDVNPKFTFPLGKEGNYTVSLKVISAKNCVDSIAIVVPVKVHTLFFVPNSFTPDGDIFNGIFKPVMSVNVDPNKYNFYVYDRWGEMLFESHDYSIGWDGTYHGKIVQDGVYIWKLSFTEESSDKVIMKKGTISLIR